MDRTSEIVTIASATPRRFIDTNILLRFITDDNSVQSPLAAVLFDRIAAGEIEALLSMTALFETVFTLQGLYRLEREVIAVAIRAIIDAPGLYLIDASAEHVLRSLELYTSIRQLSFADCYHAVLSLEHCHGEIYTFDTDFRRVPGLTRLEPGR